MLSRCAALLSPAAALALAAGISAVALPACSPIESPRVDASALPDTTDHTGPYQVTARVDARRKIESVVLVWHNLAASSAQAERTPMAQDGVTGVWSGAIPGQGAGARVAFHVEATDSSGDTAADPTFGSSAQCGDEDCFSVLETGG